MQTTTSITAASPPAPSAELTLRICGTAHDGRLVRLRGAKCTIGTDRQCTLRLKASGVSPLHCLIIRSAERTIVRRWSVETRLNGRDFSEAILQIGDRLKVGTVEFEVVDGVGGYSMPATAALEQSRAHRPPAEQPRPDEAVRRNDPNKTSRKARVRRLLDRVRELKRENELTSLRLSRLEEANGKLEVTHRELDEAHRQLQETHRRLQEEHAHSLAQVSAPKEARNPPPIPPSAEQGDLAQAQARLQAEQRGFEEQRAAWRADRERIHEELSRWNDALERRSAELDALSLELASRQTTVEIDDVEVVRHQHPQGASAPSSSASELAEERKQLDAERQALANEREAIAAQRSTLAADHERLAEAQAALVHEQARNADERKGLADEQARLTSEQQLLGEERNELGAARKQLDQDREALLCERQQWHDEQWRRDAQSDPGEVQFSKQTCERHTEPFNTQLERQRQELDIREAELRSQQQRLDAQADELSKAKAEQAEEVVKIRAELADARAQLDSQRQAINSQNGEGAGDDEALRKLKSDIETDQANLEDGLREFAQEKSAFALEQQNWQAETSRAQAEIAARREETDRRAADVEKMLAEQESVRRQLEEAQAAIASRQEALAQVERELKQRKEQFDEECVRLEAQRKDLEPGRAQLVADRESVNVQREALASQLETLESRQRELDKEQSLVTIDRQSLARERAELLTDRQALETQKQELEKERSALAAERQKLAGARSAGGAAMPQAPVASQGDRISEEDWVRRLADQARQLTEATERLNRAREELEQQHAAHAATRREFDDQRQKWQTERQRIHADHQNELENLREELRRMLADPSYSQTFADYAQQASSAGVPGGEDNPVVREVLTELRALGELSRNTTQDTDPQVASQAEESASVQEGVENEEQVSEPQADASVDEQPEARHEDGDDHQASVEDYMTRLLRRIRGVKNTHDEKSERKRSSGSSSSDESSDVPDSPQEEPAGQGASVAFKPRSVAPELSSDLMAMRELANLSARAAIDKHEYRNWGRAAFGKLAIALLAAGAGAGAIYFAESPHSLLMCAGLACLVVTLFWLLQAGILIRNVVMASRRNSDFVRAAVGEQDDSSTSQSELVENDENEEYSPAEIIAVRDDEAQSVGEGEYQSGDADSTRDD
jgi:hypothetical protein